MSTTTTRFIRIPTLFSTSSCLRVVLYSIVVECRKFYVCCVSTTSTSFISIPTLFGTRCGLCVVLYLIVVKRRYVFRISCGLANRTRKRFYANVRTGRFGCNFTVIPSMDARCGNFFVGSVCTTFSFARCKFLPTNFCAGGGLRFMALFIMSKSGDFLCIRVGTITRIGY